MMHDNTHFTDTVTLIKSKPVHKFSCVISATFYAVCSAINSMLSQGRIETANRKTNVKSVVGINDDGMTAICVI